MKQRILTGFAAAFFLLAVLLSGSPLVVMLAVLLASAIAYYEYDCLFFDRFHPTRFVRVVTYIAATEFFLLKSLEGFAIAFWIVLILNALIHVGRANVTNKVEEGVFSFRAEFLGYVYVLALFGFLPLVFAFGPEGNYFLLLLFLVVFLGDTAAYFVGSRWGRHPLAKALSPKKSVEGAIASLVVSIAGAFLWAKYLFPRELSPQCLLAICFFGFFGGILGQFGDLFESLFKRSRSTKDTGTLFPGHGGILDRADSLALAAPAYYFYLLFVVRPLL